MRSYERLYLCGGGSQTNGKVVRSYRFKFHNVMKVWGGAPVYSAKTVLRESFDETHGGSLAFISEGNLNRSERWLPRGEECDGRPHVFRKNCPA